MTEITEDQSNSFLNYSDENNPVNILYGAMIESGIQPEDIDFEEMRKLNEHFIEYTEVEQFFWNSKPLMKKPFKPR